MRALRRFTLLACAAVLLMAAPFPAGAGDVKLRDRALQELADGLAGDADPEAEAGRAGLLAFTLATYPRYRAEPAHALVAAALDRVVEGALARLMLFAPPQHGKSELASVRLPAYWLGRRPDDPVILASYGADLAYSQSRRARGVVESAAYRRLFPAVRTRRDSRAVNRWELAAPHRGSVLAVGVGGPVTGHGAMLGVIDDPFENWAQAQSAAMRDRVWEWYRTTFRTRIWEGGAIVLITTRWHADDLAGRLLQTQADRWTVLRLPALAETPGDRAANDAYLGVQSLDVARGAVNFPSAYQQFTVPPGSWHLLDGWRKNIDASNGIVICQRDVENSTYAGTLQYMSSTSWAHLAQRGRCKGATLQVWLMLNANTAGQHGRFDDIVLKRIYLNTQQVMPADAIIDFAFTLPGSPYAKQSLDLCYRISDASLEAGENYWNAKVERRIDNAAWNFYLYSVADGVSTNRITATGVGTPDTVRVICQGAKHNCFTRQDATWTKRGSEVEVSYNDTATGLNVMYGPAFTPVSLKAYPRASGLYTELDRL